MLVYNITNRRSFTSVNSWLHQIRDCADDDDVIITLVGNCLEKHKINRDVSTEEGRQFAEANNLSFREVSTDNFEQVNEAFMTLIREIYYKKRSKKDILLKPAKESIFRWFSTKKQTSNAIEKPSNQQKRASAANLESKQGHSQKETRLQSKSRSDSTPKMESKALGSKENAPSYRNADEEIDRLSKTISNLKQDNIDQLAQHTRVNRQLQAEKENLEQDKQQLETDKHQLERDKHQLERHKRQLESDKHQLERDKHQLKRDKHQLERDKQHLERDKQQLRQQVSQQQSEIRALRDQLSNRKDHDNSSDDSWKVSHKEVTVTQQELGRGGWGVIWVGVFREQKVAVKQMHEAITCRVNLDLLHREINTMAQLHHPNLLQFIGAVFDHPSGSPMIITEIMDTSLRKAYEDKSLTPSRDCLPVCAGIMRDVAVGLNYLHCLPDPIIHRDVSSANVLLESKGNGKWKTKISDFGSANKAKQAMTRAAGAAVYSAPESFQPVTITGTKRKLTTKMDVFSYGVLLCEVLNCRFPDIDSFPEMLQEMKKRYSSLHKLVCSVYQ